MSVKEVFIGLWIGILILALVARASTIYEIGSDDLRITTAGIVRRTIAFDDVVNVKVQWAFSDRFFQITYYQLGFRKLLRIEKRGLARYILLNPKDPTKFVAAINDYRCAKGQSPFTSDA